MGGFILFLVVLALIALYFLPTIIAVRRGRQIGPVVVVNFFFGWSLIGWVVAVSMALSDKSAGPAVIQNNIVMQTGAGAQVQQPNPGPPYSLE